MRPSRVALGAALGMLLAGGTVHVLTAPADAPPSSSASQETETADAPALDPKIAELESEITRLKALLEAASSAPDAGSDVNASDAASGSPEEVDAGTSGDEVDEAPVQVNPRRPVSPAISTGVVG